MSKYSCNVTPVDGENNKFMVEINEEKENKSSTFSLKSYFVSVMIASAIIGIIISLIPVVSFKICENEQMPKCFYIIAAVLAIITTLLTMVFAFRSVKYFAKMDFFQKFICSSKQDEEKELKKKYCDTLAEL